MWKNIQLVVKHKKKFKFVTEDRMEPFLEIGSFSQIPDQTNIPSQTLGHETSVFGSQLSVSSSTHLNPRPNGHTKP